METIRFILSRLIMIALGILALACLLPSLIRDTRELLGLKTPGEEEEEDPQDPQK